MSCELCGKEIYIPLARQKSFRFCSRECHGKSVLGSKENQQKIRRNFAEKHHRWKGGKTKRKDGYILLCVKGKRVFEHRYIMENHLGRKLTFNETVHHIDGNRNNNKLTNLEVLTRSEHTIKYHRKKKNGLLISTESQVVI